VQAVLHAIAEPRRREILRLVRDQEMTVGKIASHFEVSQPAISQHLRVLHGAGLVTERREGTRRIYRSRPEGLAEVRAYLEEFWNERLAALKDEAEAEERRRRDRRSRS
jgi:DNA-binding transcriptional ArsR family regulator